MSEEQPKPKRLSNKHLAFIDEYFKKHNGRSRFNGTQAYLAVYGGKESTARANATELLANTSIRAEIDARMAELHMDADEALEVLEQQARADIGVFFKLVEEWTFFPLPTYDILGAKEVVDDTDPEKPVTRTSYFVRHVVLDTDKLVDPRYSHLLREFSDSPKNGLSVKLHDKQQAARDILKMHGKFIDKVALQNPDGSALEIVVKYADNKSDTP